MAHLGIVFRTARCGADTSRDLDAMADIGYVWVMTDGGEGEIKSWRWRDAEVAAFPERARVGLA